MKRKDPRLLNECKEKIIPLSSSLNSGEHASNTIFQNFIDSTQYYENLTQEYNLLITTAENKSRQIAEHEKRLKDIKERTRAAIVL